MAIMGRTFITLPGRKTTTVSLSKTAANKFLIQFDTKSYC